MRTLVSRYGILTAALGVLAAIVYTIVFSPETHTVRTSDGDWPDYYEVGTLISDSDLVVIAHFRGETRERVEIPSPVVEHSGMFRMDIMRTYQVVDVIKGDVPNDGAVTVWGTEAIDDDSGLRSQVFESVAVSEDELYVLFLQRFTRDEEPVWGRTGEPELAIVKGEDLVFLASTRYIETAKENGYTFSVRDSVAPFSTTLEEIRSLGTK